MLGDARLSARYNEHIMYERLFDVDPPRRLEIAARLGGLLADEPAVAFAYLHGSFLTELPFHDIDIGVHLTDPPERQTQHAVDLTDRLSRHVGYPVDVRPLNHAPLSFVFHALQGELLVSHDDELLGRVLDRTGREYLDLAPLLRQATRDAFSA